MDATGFDNHFKRRATGSEGQLAAPKLTLTVTRNRPAR